MDKRELVNRDKQTSALSYEFRRFWQIRNPKSEIQNRDVPRGKSRDKGVRLMIAAIYIFQETVKGFFAKSWDKQVKCSKQTAYLSQNRWDKPGTS
jgi:hypothetical protein